MNPKTKLALALSLFVAGCASSAENITANYVSPNNYSKWTCRELEEEAQRVSAAASAAAEAVLWLSRFPFSDFLLFAIRPLPFTAPWLCG